MQHLIPTVHPAALLRGAHPITDVIRKDLEKANRISISGYVAPENLIIAHPSNPLGVYDAVRVALAWLTRWQEMRSRVAIDVETSSLNFFSCNLFSIAVSGDDDCNTAVAWTLKDLQTLPWDAELALNQKLYAILNDEHIIKIYHNSAYDTAVLAKHGFPIQGRILDTMALAHLIQPDIPKDLGWLGHTYLDVEPWKLNHKGEKQAFTKDIVELLVYNAKDALNTMKLVRPCEAAIYERGMNSTLIQYQNAFAQLATDMEIYGLPILHEKRAELGAKLQARLDNLKAKMCHMLQWPDFNPMNKGHAVEAINNPKYCGLTATKYTP